MTCLLRTAFVLGVAMTGVSCGGTDLEGGRSRTPLGPSPGFWSGPGWLRVGEFSQFGWRDYSRRRNVAMMPC